jgi:hypothetical protein
MSLKRSHFHTIAARLDEPRPLLQVLVGPRQVGKTTAALQVVAQQEAIAHYATADDAPAADATWIETQWTIARSIAREQGRAILVLDEIQKAAQWSSAIKPLVDQDRRHGVDVRALVLGSAALLIDEGLNESLAGRFERIWMGHWSWPEMHDEFGMDFDDYVRFGGYPGAAKLRNDADRWAAFVRDAIIETTIGRDVLQTARVEKPALLRSVFELACAYSSRELSYQKMVGQLQDAGNTTTIANYLELLHRAGLVRGLQKFAGQKVRQRGSSPKLLALDTGLVSALARPRMPSRDADPAAWGFLVETCVGAALADAQSRFGLELYYWRQGPDEVDFVVRSADKVLAIEVKSGRPHKSTRGMEAFRAFQPDAKTLLVGPGGIPLETFLEADIRTWIEN